MHSQDLPIFMWNLQPEIIRELVRRDDPIILEIGAWEGDDTASFIEAMPNARVVAFEPDPRPYAVLLKRFDSNGLVGLMPLAVGATTGPVTWYQSHGEVDSEFCHDHDWSLSSSIKKPEHHLVYTPQITFTETSVQCVRLDDWLGTYNGVTTFDFAWIDVQGAQRDVVAGGAQTLNKIPYIYIELHAAPLYADEPRFDELCALFTAHEPMAQYKENILFKRKQ